MALLFLSLTAAEAGGQDSIHTLAEQCESYARESKQAYRELQAAAPDSSYALALRAEAKLQSGHGEEAMALYREAAKREPRIYEVQAALASDARIAPRSPAASPPDCVAEKLACDFAAGDFDAVLTGAARLEGAPEASYWRARAFRELAARSCGNLERLPETAEMHTLAARNLEKRERYRDAVAEWRAALHLRPDDPDIRRRLAAALFLTQDYKGVLPELQQILKEGPASPNLNFFVGDALLETEQIEEAIPRLEAALRLDPKLLPAHIALGFCYARSGAPAKAVPHLEAGVALDRDGSVHYQLSRAYRATGRTALAQAALEESERIRKRSEANALPQAR